MYINLQTNAALGVNISGKVSADFALPELAGEESLTVKVIFSAGDTVHLKTADGSLIRARLDGGVILPEGSEVTLTVADKNADTITLRLAGGEAGSLGVAAALSSAARQPALPPPLLQVFNQLQTANLPVAQKLEVFTKALADFPVLAAQEPAIQEALAQLASANTAPAGSAPPSPGVGQLLTGLVTLLNTMESAAPPAPAVPLAEMPAPAIPVVADAHIGPPVAQSLDTQPSLAAPPLAGVPGVAPTMPSVTAPQMPAMPAAEPVATQTATASIIGETPAPAAQTAAASTIFSASATSAAPNASTTAEASAPSATPNAPTQAILPAEQPPLSSTQQREARQFAQQVVAELFSGEQPALQPRVAAQFVSRLFAHLGETVAQGAEALHKSARELEARLNILKEAIEHSQLPRREELLAQTNRILQQTEALRESRLLCLQLPVQFEQNRQTVELYVYRRDRQGGRKLDPQNATILLALNTEHLGRLEALIQTRGKEITLKLDIARTEAVPFLREQSASLHQLLAEAGFRLNSAAVGPLTRKTDSPQAAERALESFQRSFDGRLDFFI